MAMDLQNNLGPFIRDYGINRTAELANRVFPDGPRVDRANLAKWLNGSTRHLSDEAIIRVRDALLKHHSGCAATLRKMIMPPLPHEIPPRTY
jgi:hypothetical protein